MKKQLLYPFCALISGILPLAAANVLEIPAAKNKPVIDGVLTPGEWDDAAAFTGLQLTNDQGFAKGQTHYKMKWDKDFLYIAAVAEEKDPKVIFTGRKDPYNDCLEMFFTAPGSKNVTQWLFYAKGGNALNFVDAEYGSGFRGAPQGVRSVSKINKDNWVVEARIPAGSLYLDYFDSRYAYTFNVHRSFSNFGAARPDGRAPEYSSFSYVRGQYLKPLDFARLLLNDKPVTPVKLEKMDTAGMRLSARTGDEVLLDFPNGQTIALRSCNGVYSYDFAPLLEGVTIRVLRNGKTIFSNQYRFFPLDPDRDKAVAAEQAKEKHLGVDVLDSMKRVFTQKPYSGSGNAVALTAARNEMENFQLVLFTGKNAVSDIKVQVSELKNISGKTIPAAAWELYRQGYAFAAPIGYPTCNRDGKYPDPLYPHNTLSLAPMSVEALWACVKVPADAAPGDYSGTVTVTSQGKTVRTISVSLKVWNFNIPVKQSLRTAFCLWEREIYRLYFAKQKRPAEEFLKTVDNYAMMAIKHRLTPLVFKTPHLLPKEIADQVSTVYEKQPDGSYVVKADRIDKMVKRYLDNGAVSFCVGPEIPRANYRKIEEKDWKALWSAIYKHYKAKGMLHAAYAYPFDEPGNANRELINKYTGWMKEVAPELRILLTGANALLPSKEFTNIDMWCPQEHWVNYRTKAEAQAEGKEVWWYPCSGPWYPWPNYHLDIQPGAWRILSWASFKYKFDGILYWAMAFYNIKNPLRNNSYSVNGDGVLIYGNPADGSPVPSIRLKVIADGMEDYEYLTLLEAAVKKNAKNPAKAEMVQKAQDLLKLKDMIRYIDDYALDAASYNDFRKNAAVLIEELNK
ncbi:MAG: DUF4091 domain-containing protein [Lentisphaeria bacterium]|nr:DUF4091 domain-containing protein [Lentisphaeria bacterium]